MQCRVTWILHRKTSGKTVAVNRDEIYIIL